MKEIIRTWTRRETGYVIGMVSSIPISLFVYSGVISLFGSANIASHALAGLFFVWGFCQFSLAYYLMRPLKVKD